MLKRILGIVLISSLILSNTVNIFAANGTEEGLVALYSTETEFDGIKTTANGEQYAMEFNTPQRSGSDFIPVTRLDVMLSNDSELSTFLSSPEIPIEVKDCVEKLAQENNNPEGKIVYFTTGIDPTGSQELGPLPRSTDYFTYGGTPMRNDKVYSYGLDTGYVFIEEGVDAWKAGNTIVNISITGAGLSKNISLVAAGISALKAIIEEYGVPNVITGHGNDYLQVAMNYDVVHQFTYADRGSGWEVGCVAGRVVINEVETRQYYYNVDTGRKYTTIYEPSASKGTYEGTYYDYPWPIAKQWAGNPKTQNFDYEIGNRIFSFF